jgi:regulator of replication initiation timing
MTYATYEELEMAVEERFEEEIDELKSKIESLEEEVDNLDAENAHLNDRETDLEQQRDKLQGDLEEAQHFIDWVRDAYPKVIDDYNAVMLIQGEGYGIPKHSSI